MILKILLLMTLLTPVVFSATPPDLSGKHLWDALSQMEVTLKAAEPEQKLDIILRMKKYIADREDELDGLNPIESRKYRFTVHGLASYFDLVNFSQINAEECKRVVSLIRLEGSQNELGKDLLGEAEFVLRMVQITCRD